MIKLRFANISDLDIYYRWATDPEVRKQSFNPNIATIEEHINWFKSRLNDPETTLFVFENEKSEIVGQLRFQHRDGEYVVGLNVDSEHRGKGYSADIIRMGTLEFMKKCPSDPVIAYIKQSNERSYQAFKSAGYKLHSEVVIYDIPVFKMIYS